MHGEREVEFILTNFELGSAAVAGCDCGIFLVTEKYPWNAHEMIMGRVWEVEKWNGRGGREEGRQESP